MRKVLELSNPVMIDGAMTSHVEYDTDLITALHFAQADAAKKQAAGLKNVAITPAAEFDYGLHLYLGFAAIIAASGDKLTFQDCERIQGADLIKVMNIGRNFIMPSAASTKDNSGDSSETTAEPSPQVQPN